MSTVDEIEKAIINLTDPDLAALRAWFADFDAAAWDRQFERDVAEGRLDALADEALSRPEAETFKQPVPGSMFTPEELKVLALYRNPKFYGLGRATRLGVQYLITAGVFTFSAVVYRQRWLALVVYLEFAVFVVIRLLAARGLAGVMPAILTKYEAKIAELEAAQERIGECQPPHPGPPPQVGRESD